jgi:hypothetical protein
MSTATRAAPLAPPFRWILLAGLIGGLAEVLWVALYATIAPADGTLVAREVAESVFGNGAGGAWAAPLGIGLHMLLSIALAAAFTMVAWRWAARAGAAGIMGASLATLAAIWAVNFFVVLPALNPVFVALLPLAITFTSKMLFGAAMGYALVRATRDEA